MKIMQRGIGDVFTRYFTEDVQALSGENCR